MIYAVIDTNVLVSIMMSKSSYSTVSKILNAIVDGRITPMYNDEMVAEYREVLSRKKFDFIPEACEALVYYLVNHGLDSERVPFEEIMPDESDRVFYEIALSKDGAFLVTGNLKHFPTTPIVVTPAEMLHILEG